MILLRIVSKRRNPTVFRVDFLPTVENSMQDVSSEGVNLLDRVDTPILIVESKLRIIYHVPTGIVLSIHITL